MFEQYNFENNVRDNCSLKAVSLMFLLLSFFLSSLAQKKTHLFRRLIFETQNNLHQLPTHMSTLSMWHNRFSENENKTAEAHIPQHRDSKSKKTRH